MKIAYARLLRLLIVMLISTLFCLTATAAMLLEATSADNAGAGPWNGSLSVSAPTASDVQATGTRHDAGSLLWAYHTSQGQPLSTPALADLDGDGDLEVVVVSSGDAVYALDNSGSVYWSNPYTGSMIDPIGTTSPTNGLSFTPPPLFASVKIADIDIGSGPEILFGARNGFVCLKSDGSALWTKGLTTGNYYSTCAVTDLEGEFNGSSSDLEMVVASDDSTRTTWLEAWHGDGGAVFRETVPAGGEGGLVTSAIACRDLDGSFEGGRTPGPTEETDAEFVISTHNMCQRIWARAGTQANGEPNYDEVANPYLGHINHGTSAVGNFTGDQECEIATPACNNYGISWTGWSGAIYVSDPQGNNLWTFTTGSSQAGVISSPAVADVHCQQEHPTSELFFGCDNGKLYCLNMTSQSEMWSFDTGGRVMSSPAICNIDSDHELEVLIGSDSGKVFCLDGDPLDGIDDGVAYPGDGASRDVLWYYDVGAPVGISSPVVADINNDGQLEVVIGDKTGNVTCISAGGTCLTGQSDWPQFHNDLNNSGFYKWKEPAPPILPPHIDAINIGTCFEDELYERNFNATSSNQSALAWSMRSNATFLSMSTPTGLLWGTPDNWEVGFYWVNVSVFQSDISMGDFKNFTLWVLNVNDPPVITGNDTPPCYEDQPFAAHFNGTDIDLPGDILAWGMTTNAWFLHMAATNGNLTSTSPPLNDDVGIYWVNVSISDGNGGRDWETFELEVLNTNDPPTITTLDVTTMFEDETYYVDYNATDIDPTGDVLGWSLSANASFLSMNSATGLLSGVPGNGDLGIFWANVTVSDGKGGLAFHNFTLEVFNVNDRPTCLGIPDVSFDEDTLYSLDLAAYVIDPDGDWPFFTCSGAKNITVSIAPNGTVSLAPIYDWSGSERLTFSANDSLSETSASLNFTVRPVNDPPAKPVIAMTGTVFLVGGRQIALGNASDADMPYGDILSFTWYSNRTGLIGTGRELNLSLPVGQHRINLNVTDKAGAWAFATKDITVRPLSVTPVGPDDDVDDDVLPPVDDDDASKGDTNMILYLLLFVAILAVLGVTVLIAVFLRSRKDNEPAPAPGAPMVEAEVESEDIFAKRQRTQAGLSDTPQAPAAGVAVQGPPMAFETPPQTPVLDTGVAAPLSEAEVMGINQNPLLPPASIEGPGAAGPDEEQM